MINMKKIFIVFLMITFVYAHQKASAQQNMNAIYKSIEFEYDKENVYVSIYFNLQDYYVELGDSLTLTPQIRTHTNALELPKMILIGQGQQGFYLCNRSYVNISPSSYPLIPGQINHLYQIRVPYEPWMDHSRLDLNVDLSHIGGSPLYSVTKRLKKGIREKALPAKPDFLPGKPSRFEGIVSGESVVFDLRFSGEKSFDIANQWEMDKIKTMLDWLMLDEQVSLVGVYITAYTSADGINIDNDKLTQEQSLAFKRALQAGKNYPDALFFTERRGSAGLTELIKQSNRPHRPEVPDIINNTGIFTGHELKLTQLAQGNPYRYMRVIYFLNYGG